MRAAEASILSPLVCLKLASFGTLVSHAAPIYPSTLPPSATAGGEIGFDWVRFAAEATFAAQKQRELASFRMFRSFGPFGFRICFVFRASYFVSAGF